MAFGLDLGNLLVHLRADATQFDRTLLNAEKRLTATADKLNRVGRAMTMRVTLPLVAIGAATTKSFASFDDAMTKSLAIMGDVVPEMRKEMEELARSISRRSVTSSTELAKSYFYLASAGLSAEQSIAALGAVEKFAVAGAFDMALATDLVTDAQSALGLTVKDVQKNLENMERVTDVLIGANTLANASTQQFSEALMRAGPAMKAYGIEVEEGTAVLAAYADQGKKAAEGGELFGRMLRLMIKGFVDNREEWDRFGISIVDADDKMRPMADIVRDLTDLLSDMGVTQKASTLQMLGFQARSQQAILPLLGLGDQIERYNELLLKMRGITQQIYEKQLRSFSSQMKILWNNIKDVGLEIGSILAPGILKLNEYLLKATEFWRSLNDSVKQNAILYAAVAAAIGPVLIATGLLLKTFAFMITTVKTLIGLFVGLTAAIASPIVAIVALTAIAYVLRAAWLQNLEVIKDRMQEWFNSFKEGFDWLKDSVVGKFVVYMYNSFAEVFQKIRLNYKDFVADMAGLTAGVWAFLKETGIKRGADAFLKAYADTFDKVQGKMIKFEAFTAKTFEIAPLYLEAYGEATVERLEDLMEAVKTQFGKDADAIIALIKSKMETLQKMPISPHEQLRLMMGRPEIELKAVREELEAIKTNGEETAEVVEKIAKASTDALDKMKQKALEFSNAFRNAMEYGLEESMRDYRNWKEHVLNMLQEIYWATIRVAFIRPMANVLASGLTAGVTGLLGGFGGFGGETTGVGTPAGGWGRLYEAAGIPSGQHGGTVEKTGWAVIHKDETLSGVNDEYGRKSDKERDEIEINVNYTGRERHEVSTVQSVGTTKQVILDITMQAIQHEPKYQKILKNAVRS